MEHLQVNSSVTCLVCKKNLLDNLSDTVWEVSVLGVFLVRIFLHSDCMRRDTEYISLFSPNAGKFDPEKLQKRTNIFLADAYLVPSQNK